MWDVLDAAVKTEPNEEQRWTVYNREGMRIGRAYRNTSGHVTIKLL